MLACFIKYLYIRRIRHELRKNLMKYVSRRICMRMKSLKKLLFTKTAKTTQFLFIFALSTWHSNV